MPDLFTRIRQRKLVQWVLAYAAGAWVAFEGVGALAETWLWPPVVGQVVFMVLLAGLGVAVILAWFHGEKGHQTVSSVEVVLLLLVTLLGAGGVGLVLTRASAERQDLSSPWISKVARDFPVSIVPEVSSLLPVSGPGPSS